MLDAGIGFKGAVAGFGVNVEDGREDKIECVDDAESNELEVDIEVAVAPTSATDDGLTRAGDSRVTILECSGVLLAELVQTVAEHDMLETVIVTHPLSGQPSHSMSFEWK